MKKLFTLLFVISFALNSFAQDPISILCLVGTDPPPASVQPVINLFTELGFQVTVERLTATASTTGYDMVALGEDVGSTDGNQIQFSTTPMPMLLWKPHNVRPGGLSWAPDRGDNTPDSVILIESDHDVLFGLPDDEIQFCSGITGGANALGWVYIPPTGGYTVIGENADSDPDHHALAAIDEGTIFNGNMLVNRAFIFATSGESFAHFTDDGKTLLINICHWLTNRNIPGVGINLQHNLSDQALVYPNPSSGMIRVKLDQMASSLDIIVSGIDGRVLFTKQYHNTSFEELDLSGLHSGIYFIRLEGSGISITERLIINRQ